MSYPITMKLLTDILLINVHGISKKWKMNCVHIWQVFTNQVINIQNCSQMLKYSNLPWIIKYLFEPYSRIHFTTKCVCYSIVFLFFSSFSFPEHQHWEQINLWSEFHNSWQFTPTGRWLCTLHRPSRSVPQQPMGCNMCW